MSGGTRRARRWRHAAVAAFLAACAACSGAGEAFAHASLVASEPADGSVLPRAPERLVLTFNEPVSPLVIRLLDAAGDERPLAAVEQQDARLVVTAAAPIGQGTHVLNWRVVSADGHPVGGAVIFSIGAPSADVSAAPQGDPRVQAAIWLVRWLLYGALFVGVGGAFFRSWIAADAGLHAGRTTSVALWTGVVAALAALGLHGLDLLALPPARILDGETWAAGVRSAYAVTAGIGFAAIALALAALHARGRAGARSLSALALAGVGLALAASGHASAAEPQLLTRPAVFLHGVGVAFWAGALLPLAAALRQGRAPARETLARFSRAVPFALLPLVAAGVVLAVVQVESPRGLWTTAYGQLLLGKGALLAALFLLAAWNRYRLTRPAAAGEGRAARRLVRSIRVELALALAIFAVVAAWRFTPPPRSVEVPALLVHIHTDRAMADVEFRPGRAGPVQVTIRPLTGDFAPLDPKEITLALSHAGAGIGPIRRPAARGGDGVWTVDGLTLPRAGRWQVRVELLVSDFELIALEESAELRP